MPSHRDHVFAPDEEMDEETREAKAAYQLKVLQLAAELKAEANE